MIEPQERDTSFKKDKIDLVPQINQMRPVIFQRSLIEEDNGDELGLKKRRLTIDQVNELEKCFEAENKLDPEHKARLAEQLGLHPRQIAIWFQNRRARWKTKQLQREFGLLQANYNELKFSFESLCQEKEKLAMEVNRLQEKLEEKKENGRTKEVSDSEASVTDNNSSKLPASTGVFGRQSEPSLRLTSCTYKSGSELGLHIPVENKILDHHHMTKLDDASAFGNAEGTLNFFFGAEQTPFPWAWPEHSTR